MKSKKREVPFHLKALDDAGAFSGYGSVFGNADFYRDVVVPGAFQASLAAWQERDALPPILWQHNSDQPIGPFTHMSEDGKGLYVEGQLLIDGKFPVRQAQEAYSLLKAGAIRGMSIGYNVIDEEYDGKTNVNNLTAIDLWEVSIVTFPANVDAKVEQLKSILQSGRSSALREIEARLRDAEGLSREEAKIAVSQGFRAMLKQRDADEGQLDEKRVERILTLFDTPIHL